MKVPTSPGRRGHTLRKSEANLYVAFSPTMVDENGGATPSIHLLHPLLSRDGSVLSLVRPPRRKRRSRVANSQHRGAIAVEQDLVATRHTGNA